MTTHKPTFEKAQNAAALGYISTLKDWMKSNPNSPLSLGQLLRTAIENDQPAALQTLLPACDDLEPAIIACMRQDRPGLLDLIEAVRTDAFTPALVSGVLYVAAAEGALKSALWLVQRLPYPEGNDSLVFALSNAVLNEREAMVEALLPLCDPKHSHSLALQKTLHHRNPKLFDRLLPLSDPSDCFRYLLDEAKDFVAADRLALWVTQDDRDYAAEIAPLERMPQIQALKHQNDLHQALPQSVTTSVARPRM